jgi:hypothetical protein
MRVRTSALLAALSATLLLLPAVGASAQPARSPVEIFLRAADTSDVAAMRAALDGGSASFLKLIGGCYLRAVYSNKETHEIVGAWMCAEGPTRSRVVLATVAPVSPSKVSVSLRSNGVNNRPAPPRTGSAFSN